METFPRGKCACRAVPGTDARSCLHHSIAVARQQKQMSALSVTHVMVSFNKHQQFYQTSHFHFSLLLGHKWAFLPGCRPVRSHMLFQSQTSTAGLKAQGLCWMPRSGSREKGKESSRCHVLCCPAPQPLSAACVGGHLGLVLPWMWIML